MVAVEVADSLVIEEIVTSVEEEEEAVAAEEVADLEEAAEEAAVAEDMEMVIENPEIKMLTRKN